MLATKSVGGGFYFRPLGWPFALRLRRTADFSQMRSPEFSFASVQVGYFKWMFAKAAPCQAVVLSPAALCYNFVTGISVE